MLSDYSQIPDAIVFMIGDTSYDIKLDSPYKSGFAWQKETQTHAHFVYDWGSDWKAKLGPPIVDDWNDDSKWPPTLKVRCVLTCYSLKGYSYVAIAEHNTFCPDPDSPATNQLKHGQEVTRSDYHTLAVGIDDGSSALDPAGPGRMELAQAITSRGGLALAAHPNVVDYGNRKPSWVPADLKGFARAGGRGVEVFNNSVDQGMRVLCLSEVGNPDRWKGWAESEWDQALQSRFKLWATAGDDYTPNMNAFGVDGGSIRVLTRSDASNQADIEDALFRGDFYATQGSKGPRISGIEVDEGASTITVTTDAKSTITFTGKNGIGVPLLERQNVTTAEYPCKGTEGYVRVRVTRGSKHSWSQPIFVNQVMTRRTTLHSPALVVLGDARLMVDGPSGTTVDATTVPTSDLPEAVPPGGYIGYVYDFTADSVLSEASLTITYRESDVTTVRPERLAIYQYDPAASDWAELPSIIDTHPRTVRTDLDSLGLCTLSARDEVDPTGPAIAIVSPPDGATIADVAVVNVRATDDNGAYKVTFYLDGTPIYIDDFPPDGWSMLLDPALVVPGHHTLVAEALDNAGNSGQDQIQIVVPAGTGAAPPIVSITSPENGGVVKGDTTIAGNVTAASAPDVGVFIEDKLVGMADFDASGNWALAWDATDETAGPHALHARAVDSMGARGEATVTVTVVPPDSTPPVIAFSPNPGVCLIDSTTALVLNATALDTESGVANVTATLNGSPVSLPCQVMAPGDYEFTVSATDNAGNATTQTADYAVYRLTWVPPVVRGNTFPFQVGSTLPIKFSVWDSSARLVSGLAPTVTIKGPLPSAAVRWSGPAVYSRDKEPCFKVGVPTKGWSVGTYRAEISGPAISNCVSIQLSLKKGSVAVAP